jgi:hypothetical protein
MINQITKIQLVGTLKGYLDVAVAVPVPMTYSVGDIRDISKRTGAFSKSIILPNTKNNSTLLNHYFDINIQAGTFNINKLQQCILLQNNVPITQNAYIQLVNVKKTQNVQTEDDDVEYEVLIKDNVGDFFTKLGGSLLEEIDLSTFIHNYTSANVKASFDNTWQDGYKYVLPWIATPSSGLPKYVLSELKPAIYAKQYWDRIHANAGFSYSWSTQAASNVRFDKLLIPFNSEDKKISEETLNNVKVIADRVGQPTTDYFLDQINNGSTIPFLKPLTIPTEVQDNISIYNPTLSQYSNQFLLTPPTGLVLKFEVDYDLIVNNMSAVNIQWGGVSQYQPVLRIARVSTGVTLGSMNIGPQTSFTSPNSTTSPTTYAPGSHIVYSTNNSFTTTISNLTAADVLKFEIGIRQPGGSCFWNEAGGFGLSGEVRPTLRLRSLRMTVTLDASTVVYGFPINPNSYIPRKIKQSDFIKSVCLMYNLFVETDPNDPNKLIYKHRDQFYDTGKTVDWTEKLARDREQNLKFLPELTSKRLILSYKGDKDDANTVYTNATNEVYGQHEVVFQNEYIKNIETKELIFSPTPVQTTSFGTVGPLYNGQSPNTNIRILLDNGQKVCNNYQIENYTGNVETLSVYPMVSHMDAVTNPTFDINFGVCDFYFYNLIQFTENNLFNNFWARTMAQIDQGKLLTAYFALSEADIQYVKLNDKIRIDNSYWNINKIIDYDAGSNSLTKVELMSIDPALLLPRFGGTTATFKPSWEVSQPFKPVLPVSPVKPVKLTNLALEQKRNYNTSIINSEQDVLLMGKQNQIPTDFKGIVIGDNIIVKQDGIGIYVGDWLLRDDGTYTYTGLKFIDGGLDMTMNKMKTNPVDIIDGGFDEVRKDGGWNTGRIFIDGNDIN